MRSEVLRDYVRLILAEARKNGFQGESFEDQLKKYAARGDCYIHYSDIPKLGINPTVSFNTPVGIYAYPLNERVLKKALKNEIEFAKERKFIHVFSAKNPARVLFLSNISAESAKTLETKITKLTGVRPTPKKSLNKSPGGKLWYHSLVASGKPYVDQGGPDDDDYVDHAYKANGIAPDPLRWNKLWRSIGIDGCVDNNSSIIHSNEPEQAVFFSGAFVELIATVDNQFWKHKGADHRLVKKVFQMVCKRMKQNLRSAKIPKNYKELRITLSRADGNEHSYDLLYFKDYFDLTSDERATVSMFNEKKQDLTNEFYPLYDAVIEKQSWQPIINVIDKVVK